MISVIIPSRNEPYLHKTIQDLLLKGKNIEIIAVLDGWWPEDISTDKRVNYLHYSEARGMRNAINMAVQVARGEYILKTDAHCLFDYKYDEKVVKNCGKNTVIVPRRYRLDPDKWQVIKDGRPPIDYEYIDSSDLHGVRWDERAVERKDVLLDDIISAQGSCWVMRKDFYNKLDILNEEQFGKFFLEFQEISFKTWFSGGRVLVDKNTWYAHWHKTKGRGYSLDNDRDMAVKGLRNLVNRNKDKFDALITKFKPMPTW